MILTDLIELIGKEVEITLDDGQIFTGKLEYVPSYSEMYGFRQPKHFYMTFEENKEVSFRAHHVKSAVELKDWIFTFGCGQKHAGHYVRIKGTYSSARQEMFKRYGDKWAFMYTAEEYFSSPYAKEKEL